MRRAARRQSRRLIVIPAALAIGVSALTTSPVAAAPGGVDAHRRPDVEVVDLRVNGRHDNPLLGVGDPSPVLSWRMKATSSSASHRCHRSGPDVACPADEQTAYQVQAANSLSGLRRGNLIWDSGKVDSNVQSSVPYAGSELSSREAVAWRVRVWDADGKPSSWSEPSAWEMGLLEQSDWGDSRWIDYPGRTENQPQPVFAHQFDVLRRVTWARLYVSGVGLH
jgi:alpha-L-rhamnosidase